MFQRISLTSPRCASAKFHIPAAIPLPRFPPKLPTALASLSLLVYFSTRPLLSFSISLYLRSRFTIGGLCIRPLRREVELRRVNLHDPQGRHLVSLDALQISLRPFAKQNSAAENSPSPTRQVLLTLDKPALTAVFDSYDLTTSNWTLFVEHFLAGHRTAAQSKAPSVAVVAKSAKRSVEKAAAASATDVRVCVKNGVRLSLRSALLDNRRLIPDVTLANVSLSAADIQSPESLARYVDALAGRAVNASKISALPREFRNGARKYARRVLREGFAKGIRVTRESVENVRKRVEVVDEYILKDLPDSGAMVDKVQTVKNVLKGIESLLGGGNQESSVGDGMSEGVDKGGQIGHGSGRSGQVRNHDEEDKSDFSGDYRELDEGDAAVRQSG